MNINDTGRINDMAEIPIRETRAKSHDLHLSYAKSQEDAEQARKIIQRYKKEYEKGSCFCICECCDSTLVKEGGEIWQNWDQIKLVLSNENHVDFYTDFCPICGRELPTPDGGRNSNGMRII